MPKNTPNPSEAARLTPAVFSARSDEWYTPQPLVDALADRYANGHFTLDVAATAQSAKAPRYYDAATDALTQDWHADASDGAVWCNPPYSAAKDFMHKAAATAQQGTTVVCLVPNRSDTGWYHDTVFAHAAEVLQFRGRIRFTRPDGTGAGAPFPSVVIVFRPNTTCLPRFEAILRDGTPVVHHRSHAA